MNSKEAYEKLKETCVLSPYAPDKDGYCNVRIKDKSYKHHRLVYAAHIGVAIKDLAGKIVMHKCDNPSCINPEHLELGTQVDNMRDMIVKGRASRMDGNNNPNVKISAELAKKIKDTLKTSRYVCTEIADMFSVTVHVVHNIQRGRTWRNI